MKFLKKVIFSYSNAVESNYYFGCDFKADETYSLKNLFNEHLSKFNVKHDEELAFLEDVRYSYSFLEIIVLTNNSQTFKKVVRLVFGKILDKLLIAILERG